jgi:FtsP/CotA-like multicopper oxidase with cupredoxin domain
MADGTVIYGYGYIGGRSTDNFTYQNSMTAPPGSPKTYVPGAIVPGGVAWPAPGNAALEAQFAGNAQFPGPLIRCAVGDVVYIYLKNLGVTTKTAPNDPHTIHLHGMDVDAANDGVPETSVAAIPANMALPGAGNVIVYMFSPTHAGTYMYHCHQEADIHVTMGMYGALVVYESTDLAYQSWYNGGGASGPAIGGGILHGWSWTKETILLLSETDIRQHNAEQKGGMAGGYNPVDFKPQYWFINGLSFPNTVHAGFGFNWSTWIAAHPGYDPFIIGSVDGITNGLGVADKVLLRVINLGFQTQPMHMHGFHAKIIGSDQRAWPWANTPGTPSGQGMEKNTLTVGSGETYEWLIDFGTLSGKAASTYQPGTQSRYDPLALNAPQPNTNQALPAIPDPFAPGKAYVGGPTVGPDGIQGTGGLPAELPITTGQYFPFHNHDDYKATNNGVYPGGMFTLIETLP